jgi:cellobiose phosphorylase
VESLLGLRLEGNALHIAPCLPADWRGFTVRYRYRETVYVIAVAEQVEGTGKATVIVDGVVQLTPAIPLMDDHREHAVKVQLAIGCGEE